MLTWILGLSGLIFAVVSARTGWHELAYGVIAVTIISCLLCAWDKLDKKWLPVLVFCLGLAFLFQTTLKTDNLIGTDIHTEYYIYEQALDSWDTNYPHSYNTSIGSTIIAPFLTKYLGINGYVIYKVIFPLLFAFVPLILYLIYNKEFGHKTAFFASVVFFTLPTYLLEMIGLPRQMLGELMLSLVMFLIVMRPVKNIYLIFILLACVILGILFHYVMFPIILGYIIGATGILTLIKLIGRWWKSLPKVKVSLVMLGIIVLIGFISGYVYYKNTAQGTVANNLSIVFGWLERHVKSIDSDVPTPIVPATAVTEITSTGQETYLEKHEPLIRTALGIDFKDADLLGKAFRIWQFMAQICLLAGCVYVFINRRNISAEYIALILSSIVMLGVCVLLPRFSNIINATRFYHIALFTLSPVMVLGGKIIFNNYKLYITIFLIGYVMFMSGAMFELSKESDTSKITAPYSIALSNYRINVVGEFTPADKKVMDYIVDNDLEPVLSDINGMLLLSQRKEPFEYINRSYRTGIYYTVYPLDEGKYDLGQKINELYKGWGYLPKDVTELNDGVYVYVTGESMKTKTLTFKPQWYFMVDTASGMRVRYPFDYLKLTDNYEVVYQVGDAALLRIRRNN